MTVLSHDATKNIILREYEEEYKDLADTWRALETKAQGTAAVSGVFLAAGATLAKNLLTGIPFWGRVPFVVSLLALVTSSGAAVASLRIKNAPRRPSGDAVAELAAPLLRGPAQGADSLSVGFVGDRIEMWAKTNDDLLTTIHAKARAINQSQWLLFTAVGLFTLYVVVVTLLAKDC